MKLRQRVKRAYNAFRNKSENNDFLDFLGVRNVPTNALSEATYFACLKVLSEAIGKLPLKLLHYNDQNGVITARDHPLYTVLRDRPNPYMTSTTFWSTVEYNRNHYGNAYVLIDGAGEKTRLWIMPSDEVEVWYDDMKLLGDIPDIYYIYSHGGKRYKFGSEEVMHFKTSNMLDGIVGISVQDQLKATIEGGAKAQALINKMYDSGFTAKAVLQYTGSLSDDNVKSFVAGIESYAKGELKNEGIENIIPIPLGATLTPLNVKLADNQFIEVKQYTALQIASAFGIKPYQIGDYTKSSYASAEAQQLSFYVDTLLYIVKQYEEELTYKLLAPEECQQGYHFKFNIDVILRADFATKINTLSTAVNSFLYTPNEARAKLDLGNIEGGDRLLGNGASIPVQLTGSQYMTNSDNPDSTGDSVGNPEDSENETKLQKEVEKCLIRILTSMTKKSTTD
ncbi:phage portal protein [Hominilimicola sp.]|uniref:phage portal protein n=1 Tax=Hominilimicola sp. TaxID=3073571 RepID=UPI00205D545D|nr:MAG TPA: portal protein [Caudoviricetes sp.]